MTNKTLTLWQTISNPTDQFDALIRQRKQGILSQFKKYQESDIVRQSLLVSTVRRMLQPVNPLLLATALSISSVRDYDFNSFIEQYCAGLDVSDLEASLIKLDDFQDDDELSRILELEEVYIQSLIALGLQVVASGGEISPVGPGYVIDEPTMWNAFWGAWLSINPIYQDDNLLDILIEIESEQVFNAVLEFVQIDTYPLRVWAIAMQYSEEVNSSIHNAREYYEYRLNQVNIEINQVLQRNSPLEEKKRLLTVLTKRQLNATRLSKRAFRLYQWIPDEISAFAAETRHALKQARQLRSETAKGKYAEYELPSEIIEQRNKRKESQRRSNGTTD